MALYLHNVIFTVNATKTKVMIFRKGGRVDRNKRFIYKETVRK